MGNSKKLKYTLMKWAGFYERALEESLEKRVAFNYSLMVSNI